MLTRGGLLVIASLTASLTIVPCLFIPGWWIGTSKVGIDSILVLKSSISLSALYSIVCGNEFGTELCLPAPLWDPIEDFDDFAGRRWTIEGVFCLIATFIGCIMAVILGKSVRKENDQICRSTSNCVGIIGLIHVVIGAICGLMLLIECIILNQKDSPGFETSTPYCLIIVGVGLVIQCVAIGSHIACLQTTYINLAGPGMILTPSINVPSQVFIHTTTSTYPYVPLTNVA